MSWRHDVAADSIQEGRPSRSLRTRLDLARAILEGPVTWRHSTEPAPELQPTFLLLGLVGAIGTTLATIVVMTHATWPASQWARLGLAAGLVLMVAFVATSTWALWQRTDVSASNGNAAAIVRGTAVLVLAAFWLATAPPTLAALAWPIGVLIGLEAAVVGNLVGAQPWGRGAWRESFLSPIHLGLVAPAAAMAVLAPDRFRSAALTALISIESAGIAAIAVRRVLNQALTRAGIDRIDAEQRRQQTEARHRAHWIHDDVCAEIRQLRLRMSQGDMSTEQLTAELNRFEGRLRERQLDEVIASGSVSAAEVLQPFVRRAQSAGVVITNVPNFDEASIELDPEAALLLKRCVAGFVTNAIDAGASSLGFHLTAESGRLHLEVTDDAGGFELAKVPAGRGLWTLRAELGECNLHTRPSPYGTTMVAVLNLKAAG